MEPHERVRYLRKQYLKMTQTEFGEHLGVSRSVINNIELNYLSRPEKKISLLKLICREFGVSEEWLLYGKGEMLVDNVGVKPAGSFSFGKNCRVAIQFVRA